MEQIVRTDEIPHHADLLFIKLYCKRKATKDKKTIEEAKKSWKELSVKEKRYFCKTSAESNLLRNAHSIRKIETYLKQKFPKTYVISEKPKTNEDITTTIEPHTTVLSLTGSNTIENVSELSVTDDLMEIESIDDENQDNTSLEVTSVVQRNSDNNQEANDESHLCQPTVLAPSTENNETKLEETLDTPNNTNSNQEGIVEIPLMEPVPPTVKDSRELYELIKKPGDKDWKDITRKEKTHYFAALRALKREYIKNYTKYLESLSQQQLFDHYMKTLY